MTPSNPMAIWSAVWKKTPDARILSRKPTVTWAATIRKAAP